MKKEMDFAILPLILLVVMLSFVSAQDNSNLQVTKTINSNTVIAELNDSATYTLNIFNKGSEESYELYSYVGVDLTPKGKFIMKKGDNALDVTATPLPESRVSWLKRKIVESNNFQFEYQLIGKTSGVFKDGLSIRIVPISEAIKVNSKILPKDAEAKITITNLENASIPDLTLKMSSLFFSGEKTLSLKPNEEVTMGLPINKEKIAKLKAGSYLIDITAEINSKTVEMEGSINYLENESISVSDVSSGWLIVNRKITKTDEGNLPATAIIGMKRNIISRLFTTFNVEPTKVERKGVSVSYTWQKNLNPSESLIVSSRTNYTIPFVIIILIIAIALLAKIYSSTSVVANKRVSFVRTKTGVFALKVTINVKAKKNVSDVKLHDKIPTMARIYEHFVKTPDHINHSTGTLGWNLGNMSAGEEKVFSYIIYNPKLKVVGRYELPVATLTFNHNSELKTVHSNRAFFLSEIARGD
jgi:hypothetical protein